LAYLLIFFTFGHIEHVIGTHLGTARNPVFPGISKCCISLSWHQRLMVLVVACWGLSSSSLFVRH